MRPRAAAANSRVDVVVGKQLNFFAACREIELKNQQSVVWWICSGANAKVCSHFFCYVWMYWLRRSASRVCTFWWNAPLSLGQKPREAQKWVRWATIKLGISIIIYMHTLFWFIQVDVCMIIQPKFDVALLSLLKLISASNALKVLKALFNKIS